MRPQVYQALIDLAKNKDQKSADIIIDAIKQNNKDDLCLTIKGYTQLNGLSKFIHEDIPTKQHVYQVTGPMGKGLNPASGGKHVAYAAGTGVLVYVDLVGHLILKEVAKQGGPDVLGTLRKEPEYAEVP